MSNTNAISGSRSLARATSYPLPGAAGASVEKLAGLSDEEFQAHADFMAGTRRGGKVNAEPPTKAKQPVRPSEMRGSRRRERTSSST